MDCFLVIKKKEILLFKVKYIIGEYCVKENRRYRERKFFAFCLYLEIKI